MFIVMFINLIVYITLEHSFITLVTVFVFEIVGFQYLSKVNLQVAPAIGRYRPRISGLCDVGN